MQTMPRLEDDTDMSGSEASSDGDSASERDESPAPEPRMAFRSLQELTSEFQRRAPHKDAKDDSSFRCGSLRKFYVAKGFGFVAADDLDGAAPMRDVFMHISDVIGADRKGGRVESQLVPGTRLRFRCEVDSNTGKPRARQVSLLSSLVGREEESTEASESERERPRSTRGFDDIQAPASNVSYSKEEMLTTFAVLRRRGALSKRGSVNLGTVTLPDEVHTCSAPSRADLKESPELNDELLIAKLEDRLSRESGADVHNAATFPNERRGWSFEQAVQANARIAEGCHTSDCVADFDHAWPVAPAEDEHATYTVADLFAAQQSFQGCGFGSQEGAPPGLDPLDLSDLATGLEGSYFCPDAASFDLEPVCIDAADFEAFDAPVGPQAAVLANAAMAAAAAPPFEGSLRPDAVSFEPDTWPHLESGLSFDAEISSAAMWEAIADQYGALGVDPMQDAELFASACDMGSERADMEWWAACLASGTYEVDAGLAAHDYSDVYKKKAHKWNPVARPTGKQDVRVSDNSTEASPRAVSSGATSIADEPGKSPFDFGL